MNIGEIVRLKRPFKPTPDSPDYQFGLVVGIAQRESDVSNPTEVVIHLYEPTSSTTYADEVGMQVMYSFSMDEIEVLR